MVVISDTAAIRIFNCYSKRSAGNKLSCLGIGELYLNIALDSCNRHRNIDCCALSLFLSILLLFFLILGNKLSCLELCSLGIRHSDKSALAHDLSLAIVFTYTGKRADLMIFVHGFFVEHACSHSSGNQDDKDNSCDPLNSSGLDNDPKKSRKLILVPIYSSLPAFIVVRSSVMPVIMGSASSRLSVIIIPITAIISSIFFTISATPGISHIVIIDIVVVFIIFVVIIVLIIPAGIDIFYIPVVLITLVELIIFFIGIITHVRFIALI